VVLIGFLFSNLEKLKILTKRGDNVKTFEDDLRFRAHLVY